MLIVVILSLLTRKHQNLESDLDNEQNRIDDVIKAGEEMMDGDHFASDEIKAKVKIQLRCYYHHAFPCYCNIVNFILR